MKKLVKYVENNIISIFSIRKLLLVTLLYSFLNIMTNKLYEIKTFNELITYSFYGGKSLNDVLIISLTWIAVQMILMYINLDFINNELNIKIKMIICRIKSKRLWVGSVFIAILISCFLYYLVGLIILGVFNWRILLSSFDYLYTIKVLTLLSLYSFSISMIGFLLTVSLKHETIIITIILFCYCSALSIKGEVSKYIIFSQGILERHYNNIITFLWSYLFITIFSILLCMVVRKLLLRRDIL
ncbi:MAG: hypothetical protein E7214_13860 [Clostridium sp.]|nr:hypothetical protein [Clostridium sp.]